MLGPMEGRRAGWTLVALAVALATALPACTQGYQAGTLLARSPERSRRIGCLDVAVEPAEDESTPPHARAFRFALGNACDRAIAIDLRALDVTGGAPGGSAVALSMHDPRSELRAAELDARWTADVVIAFVPPSDDAIDLRWVCVDVSSITPDGAAARAAPVCFGLGAEGGAT